MQHHATIVGAGIAGLTSAIALHQRGWSVEVLEAAPEVRAAGAGISLASNAIQALDLLGLAQLVIDAGKIIKRVEIHDDRGSVLSSLDATFLPAPNVAIHRSALHKILMDALPPNTIHTNQRITTLDDLQQTKDAGRQTQDAEGRTSDVFIVSDGIHSTLRSRIIPNSAPRYAGYTCWRGVVTMPDLDIDHATEAWGMKGRFGIVPIGNGQIYWFACVNAPQNDPAMRAATIPDLMRVFAHYASPIPEILHATPTDAVIWGDICDIDTPQRWVYDRTVFIGDAAHATTPNLGQGACQAIEDAVILAHELDRGPNIDQALSRFEHQRIPRVTSIVKRSRRLGAIAQSQGRIISSIRNHALRLTSERTQQQQMLDVCRFRIIAT